MKKILLIAAIISFILLSVPLTVYLVRQRQELRMRATPATVLSLTPATISKPIGETFTVQIQIDTGMNTAAAADLILTYNPEILTATSVNAGDFFTEANLTIVKNIIDHPTGKITFSLFTVAPRQGSGVFATISFEGASAGSSSVNFANDTIVGDVNEGNVLENTIPGYYTITSVGGFGGGGGERNIELTQSPTPTPTLPLPTATSPQLQPTPTGSATPTTTLIPSLTPTATPASQGNTPTPTISPDDIPETGIISPTVLFLFGASISLVLGFALLALRPAKHEA